jgi:PAS domain S-box-containing protein
MRNRIMDEIIKVSFYVSVPLLVVSLLRSFQTGWKSIYAIHILCFLIIFVLFGFSKRLTMNVKALMLNLLILISTSLGLYTFGLLSTAPLYLILSVIFTGLFVSRKAAYLMLTFIVVILLVFAALFRMNILDYEINIEKYLDTWSVWFFCIVSLVTVSMIILIFNDKYLENFIHVEQLLSDNRKNTEQALRSSLERQEEINAELGKNYRLLQDALVKVEENQIKYHALFDNANDAIFLIRDDRFVECNKKTLEMFQVLEADIINHTPFDFSPPFQPSGQDSRTLALEKIHAAYTTGAQSFSWQHRKLNGELFDTEVALNSVEIQGIKYLQAIVRDITERIKAEKDLVESEKNFKNIFHASTDGIIISDPDYNILSVNLRVISFLNQSMEDLKKKSLFDFVLPEYLPTIMERKAKMAKNIPVGPLELPIRRSPKELVPVEINSTGIVYENKNSVLTILRDISERKQVEKKILQAIIDTEEKERVRFAKELHDGLGPVLSTIKLYFQWLSETNDPVKKQLIIKKGNDNIEEAIMSLREISNNLSPHLLNNFGLCDAIEQFIERLSQSGSIQISFQTNTHDRFKVEIEITFYRIITELIHHTLKHSGATEISLVIQKDEAHHLLILNYSDNGKGFDAEKIRRKNSGLGLFNMENRIRTLGGTMVIISKTDSGMSARASINYENQGI